MQTLSQQHLPFVRLNDTCVNGRGLTMARGLKPGQAVLDTIGGAHKFQAWPHNILTGAPIRSACSALVLTGCR